MKAFARPLAASAAAIAVSLWIRPAACAAAEPDSAPTSVWKVQAKGGKASLYLAGSIHLLREEDYPLPAAFDEAYKACDELLLEVAGLEAGDAQEESMRRGIYGGEGKISDDLSADAYAKLREYLGGAGVPRGAMDGFRPWMAAMMLSLTEMMKLGGQPELGVDSYFEEQAVRDGKTIKGLETSDFQIGLFAGLSREDQEKMLIATLGDLADVETGFPEMIRAWRAGDNAALEEIVQGSMLELPALREEVFVKRNARWVKKIEAVLAGERDVMMVVGAGHLIGETGVVALLRAKGYELKRVGEAAEEKRPDPKKPERFVEI